MTVNTTAKDVAENAEEIAPVSGARCRGCGKSARLAPPLSDWYVVRKAAWCKECHEENVREEQP